MAAIKMPTLGAYMDKAKVLEWYVAPGDTVAQGDIIALVETDKASVEVECFEAGVISGLVAQVGQTVKVGDVLAEVGGEGDGASKPAPEAAAAPPPEAAPAPEAPGEAPPPAYPEPLWGGIHATPLARSRAQALGVDLAALQGSGPGDAVTVADVLAAAQAQGAAITAPPAPPRRVPGVALVRQLPVMEALTPRDALGERLASPAARRRLAELGLEAASVGGDGPLTLTAVEAAAPKAGVTAAPQEASAPKAKGPEPSAMRQAIARAMSRAKREIPHYYLEATIPMGRALEWLRATNEGLSVTERILPAAMLLRAVALAARKYPEMNGYYEDDRFTPAEAVHLGNAINLRKGGLVVPALLNAGAQPLPALMADLKDLTTRAKAGRLKRAELTDATLTVTSLGDRGADAVYGVIYPPQVAIVGFGRIHERPWVQDGQVSPCPVVIATLSADHRVSDGHRGGLFLGEIRARLMEPESL